MRIRVTNYGEPILREVGHVVTEFNPALKSLATDMIDTMHAEEGIGLAAQQIGIALQLCVIDIRVPKDREVPFNYLLDGKHPPLELIMPLIITNPEISITDLTESVYEEGCLSFPNVLGNVTRATAVRCAYQDADGNPHSLECDGLLARCLLHEVDHLHGRLFIDSMDKRALKRNETRIKKLKRASRAFLKSQPNAESSTSAE